MLKKIIYTAVLSFSILVSTNAISDESHGHVPTLAPTNEQIIFKASQELGVIVDKSKLIEGNKLDASWKHITGEKVHKQSYNYYIISFTHPKENKTLYIQLSSKGSFIDANFNGNFKAL